MNQKERQGVSKSRARAIAQAGTDRLAMGGGGYLAGRYMRNSKLDEYPMTVAVGVVGLLGMRRAKSIGGKGARLLMAGAVGAGCYGMGKIGEKHGEKAGNDGNLFSWGKKKGEEDSGFYTD